MIQLLRGMKDILPPESGKWEELQHVAEEVFSSFGYGLSITPVVEKTELFVRSVGEDTDVVSKEMYTCKDRGDESITLRPEGTASIIRAYLSSPEWKSKLLKTWYWGPMFRYERPQKGRYRQFFQFGLEAIGTDSPHVDAELIYLLNHFYKKIGIDDARVEINSIGCPECRPAYKNDLVAFFMSKKEELCGDCKGRLDTNPLRLLDCKNPSCSSLLVGVPNIQKYLCNTCTTHNERLLKDLDKLKVVYNVNPNLVRGLDYYTRTVFEFVTDKLGGRQNALGGGGRYDVLSAQLGEKAVPSVGYAGGVERTIMLMSELEGSLNKIPVYVAMMDDETLETYLPLILELKKYSSEHNKIKSLVFVEDDFKSRDIKKHLSRADKSGAKFALIAGAYELRDGLLSIKDLTKKQETKIKVDLNDLKKTVHDICGRIFEEENS
ncbi:MAG: histidine--tRNA ligase [bacterium]